MTNSPPDPTEKVTLTSSPRQRFLSQRQRRQNLVFSVLAVIMGVAALVSLLVLAGRVSIPFLSDFDQSEDYAKSGDVPCVPEGAQAVALDQITVKVLNATGQPGLAASIGDRLKAHGVTLEEPGNYSGQFYGTTQISAGSSQIVKAYTIARLFPEASVRYSESDSPYLTIILGDHFSDMVSDEEIKTLLESDHAALTSPTECNPVEGL